LARLFYSVTIQEFPLIGVDERDDIVYNYSSAGRRALTIN